MQFDPENPIVKLCAEGMNHEGDGTTKAAEMFMQARNEASDNFEKCIAAHYIARQQQTVTEKLEWDQTALKLALNLDDEKLKGALPSLYLNVGKCYEDLADCEKALQHYKLGESFFHFLEDDGYGNFTKSAIQRGIARVSPTS
jgi:hypothetical protein